MLSRVIYPGQSASFAAVFHGKFFAQSKRVAPFRVCAVSKIKKTMYESFSYLFSAKAGSILLIQDRTKVHPTKRPHSSLRYNRCHRFCRGHRTSDSLWLASLADVLIGLRHAFLPHKKRSLRTSALEDRLSFTDKKIANF